MDCGDRVSAHVEVKVVWSAHGGPAVVDGRDGGGRGVLGVLGVLAIKRVGAGGIVGGGMVLGVAMGVVLVVVVLYLHLVAVAVVAVVAGSFQSVDLVVVVVVVVEEGALCRLGVRIGMAEGFNCGKDRWIKMMSGELSDERVGKEQTADSRQQTGAIR